MKHMPNLSRRTLFVSAAAAAGGLALGFHLPQAHAVGAAAEINAWVVIAPDDAVTIRIARSEMGQGMTTALAMLVAEELACDWSKVRTEFAAPEENLRRNHVWGPMGTGGSRSVRDGQQRLRQAGATARRMLLAAAAERWGVGAGECHAEGGVITHAASGRKLRFGEVAADAAKRPPPVDATLKDEKDWTLLGTPRRRLDARPKVTGQPLYGIDVRVPGMLYAAILQCPVFGGSLKSCDPEKASGKKGVHQVVQLPDAVAVVADSWWQATQALAALPVSWDDNGNGRLSSAAITADLRAALQGGDAAIVHQQGDVEKALAGAAKRLEAEYAAPFLAHATMEPMNCTAQVKDGRVEIWVPTQNGDAALQVAAQAAGVSPGRVAVHKTQLGGGFGRRGSAQDFVRQAVLVAKAVGRPVKLLWSREEDTRHDFYRPVAMAHFTAGLDADGMPVALRVRVSGPSIFASLFHRPGVDASFADGFTGEMEYAVPNLEVGYAMHQTPVPVGFWRSVNHSQNGFFRESFIDEMAHAAGADPYQYRRKLLAGSPKRLAVLDAAAKQAEWGTPLPSGHSRGIALVEAYGSLVAEVVEASLGEDGAARAHRVTVAIDSGHVANPLGLQAQMESGIVYALTAALYGQITIDGGRVKEANFDDYQMLRMAQMPAIDTVLVPSGGFWGGGGEPGTPPLAPALCNALYGISGKRIRSLPLKSQDLRRV